jgi:hypothetical protein
MVLNYSRDQTLLKGGGSTPASVVLVIAPE